MVRRYRFLADEARERQRKYLDAMLATQGRFDFVQYDELHTFEHSKCKPTVVGLVVCARKRIILGYSVAQIPASGLLAAVARQKYGYRADHSNQKRHGLFNELRPYIAADALIATDEHKRYPAAIKKHFPGATHNTYKSIRGCVTGQGEMKKAQFDPLFTVNHTLAMLRARINRLVRRTWCTTKKNERLHDHLALYIDYHNRVLINNPAT